MSLAALAGSLTARLLVLSRLKLKNEESFEFEVDLFSPPFFTVSLFPEFGFARLSRMVRIVRNVGRAAIFGGDAGVSASVPLLFAITSPSD